MREARKREGYSQTELGKILGVSFACISKFENGIRPIPDRYRMTLDTVLGTALWNQPEELIGPEPTSSAVTGWKTEVTSHGSRITIVTRLDGSTFRVRVPPGGMEDGAFRGRAGRGREWITELEPSSARRAQGGTIGS